MHVERVDSFGLAAVLRFVDKAEDKAMLFYIRLKTVYLFHKDFVILIIFCSCVYDVMNV